METGNIIGLAGFGVLVISALLPFAPFKVPRSVVYCGLAFGFLLVFVAAIETWQRISPGLVVTIAHNGTSLTAVASGWPSAIAYGSIFASMMWVTVRVTQWFWTGFPTVKVEDSSPQYTADQIIGFMKCISVPNKILVKLVAIQEWAILANAVEDAFKLTGYKLELNKDDSDYIFRSKKPHSKVILRSDGGIPILLAITAAFLSFNIFTEIVDFAPEDRRGYIQIEIGGAP